jgi:hypothetical protein
MVFVKVSLVSGTGYRRWRAKELAQSGQQIRRGRRRGINVCSKHKLPLSGIVGSFMYVRSIPSAVLGTGRGAMLFVSP